MTHKLKYQRPGVQFAVFFALAAGMFIIGAVLAASFSGDLSSLWSDSKPLTADVITRAKWVQFFSSILTFIVPAVIFAYLADEKPWRYVGFKREFRPQLAFAVFFVLIAVQPFAMLLGEINNRADFGSMESILRNMENMNERIMTSFLTMNSPVDLAINIIIVAVIPAIGEELFFRGALQNILERWTNSPLAAILIASFGFALLHGTLYKFLPILCLGIALGVIFYVTRNLWYCILFHLLNNTLAVLAVYYAQRNDFMKKLADEDFQLNWWTALISLVITIGIIYFMRRKVPYQPLERPWRISTSHDPRINRPHGL